MRDVRFHLDLQVILVLCLLVPVLFLQDSVTGYGGDEPLMCNHGKVYKVSLYFIHSYFSDLGTIRNNVQIIILTKTRLKRILINFCVSERVIGLQLSHGLSA